jgi:TolA-binding protein
MTDQLIPGRPRSPAHPMQADSPPRKSNSSAPETPLRSQRPTLPKLLPSRRQHKRQHPPSPLQPPQHLLLLPQRRSRTSCACWRTSSSSSSANWPTCRPSSKPHSPAPEPEPDPYTDPIGNQMYKLDKLAREMEQLRTGLTQQQQQADQTRHAQRLRQRRQGRQGRLRSHHAGLPQSLRAHSRDPHRRPSPSRLPRGRHPENPRCRTNSSSRGPRPAARPEPAEQMYADGETLRLRRTPPPPPRDPQAAAAAQVAAPPERPVRLPASRNTPHPPARPSPSPPSRMRAKPTSTASS